MELEELKALIKENGIVGAGGAGFPTYMKIDKRANTILLNCAECEPLLKLHRQLLKEYAKEIIKTFSMMADCMDAQEAIICIKEDYHATIEAVNYYIKEYPKVTLKLLPSVYPMGDEVVLIYEATGKVVAPGGLPIESGIAVFNVETVYNVYITVDNFLPVTNKLLTIVGEVENPVTVRVPLGTSLREAVDMAGGEKKGIGTEELVYFVGGPMMGKIGSPYDVVTKTTNAILVLPSSHIILQKKQTTPSLNLKRAASACCQCRTCTDLCPRHNLGHPIEPHKFMQAVSNHDVQDMNTFLDLFFCSGCGLCEMFSCPQSLSPRSLIAECKNGLRQAGIKPTKCEADDIKEAREYRKVPENRLEARLGLSKYETNAPLENQVQGVKTVRIPLLQHIGAPATSIVTKGSHVLVGQMIAKAAEGLSVPIHASIEGIVIESNDNYIEIEAIS